MFLKPRDLIFHASLIENCVPIIFSFIVVLLKDFKWFRREFSQQIEPENIASPRNRNSPSKFITKVTLNYLFLHQFIGSDI